MNILFWVNTFPAISETFIRDQVVAVLKHGIQAKIYCSRTKNLQAPNALTGFEAYNLLKHTYDETDVLPNGWYRRKFLVYVILVFSVFKGHYGYYKRALKIIRHDAFPKAYQLFFQVHFILKHHIDVIHAHYGTNGLQAAVLKDLGLPVKFITTFHGYDIRLGLKKPEGFYMPLFKLVDAVIAISTTNRNHLMVFGLPEHKIVDMPNGIDTTFFKNVVPRLDDQTIRVLTVARLEAEKALDIGIKAFGGIVKLYPKQQFRYTIIGEGPLREDLETLIRRLHLEDKVFLLGAASSQEVKDAMNQSDIFMLSSAVEVLPTVLLEAQACELPILATNVGSVKTMVANGVIVQPNSIECLVEGMQLLLSQKAQWGIMGLTSRQFVEAHFDRNKISRKLMKLYNNNF